jgi:hypothetical protein
MAGHKWLAITHRTRYQIVFLLARSTMHQIQVFVTYLAIRSQGHEVKHISEAANCLAVVTMDCIEYNRLYLINRFNHSATELVFVVADCLCWLLGTSVYKIGKLRRDNLSSSTSPSPRDAPPSNVRSSKALLHEYESTGLSNKAEGWPVLSARRRKTGRECTNTLSGTPWLHALSIVYAALR